MPLIHAIILAFSSFYLSSCIASDLDSTLFKINISKVPVKLTEVTGEHVEVFSKYGQQFTCSIPEALHEDQKDSQASISTRASDVLLVMANLNSSDCLVHSVGWWTYKLCIGETVYHYHEENGKEVSTAILGRYSSDFDWKVATAHDKQVKQRYHSQYYRNGDLCDVTSSPRTVEVQYLCHGGHSVTFLDVAEPETCTYVLRVGVPDLCDVESLTPLLEEDASEINCFPGLSDYDYLVFTEAEQTRDLETKKAAELKSFQKLLKRLPTLRNRVKQKILMSGRTYRNQQKLNHYLAARRFIHRSLKFINDVESNFEESDAIYPSEFNLFSSLLSLSQVSSKHGLQKGRSSTLVQKVIQVVTLPSKMSPNDFTFQNRTFVIIPALITHLRRNFEWQVENKQTPHILSVLHGFVNLLQEWKKFRGSRHLDRIERALLRATIVKPHIRPTLTSVYSKRNEKSYDLSLARQVFDLLNATAIYSHKAILLAKLKSTLISMLHPSFKKLSLRELSNEADDLPIQVDLGDFEELFASAMKPRASDETTDDDTSNVENLSSTFSEMKRLLGSSRLKSFLSKFTKNSRKKFTMRANLQDIGDGSYAVYLTVDESNSDRKHHLNNEQNYAFKINGH